MGLVEALQKRCLEAALLAAVAGVTLGHLAPSTAKTLKMLMPLAVFLMMLQPMYALKLEALRERWLRSKLRFIMLVTVLYTLVYPCYTLAYLTLASRILPPQAIPMLVGAALVALAPVALPAPTFVAIAGGDVEAAILSILWTFLLSFIVIPAYAYIMLHATLHVPTSKIVYSLAAYIAAPLALGQALRRLTGSTTGRHSCAARLLTIISLASLYYVILTSFAASEPLLSRYAFAAILLTLTLFAYFAARFATAYMVGSLTRLEEPTRIALVYAASGNGAIGIALSAPLGEAPLTGAVIAGPLVLITIMTSILRLIASKHHPR